MTRCRRPAERVADLIALLTKAPRYQAELVHLTELDVATVRAHLAALGGEGLIEPVLPPRYPQKYRWIA